MGKKLLDLQEQQEQQTTNTTSNRQNYTTRGRSRLRQSYNPTPRFNNGRGRGFLLIMDLSVTDADNLDISSGNVM